MKCKICGAKPDLFSSVTSSPTCAICTLKFMGGLPQTDERIEAARSALSLQPGELLQQDNGAEACRILGRR